MGNASSVEDRLDLYIDGEKTERWPQVLLWAAVAVLSGVVARHDTLSYAFDAVVQQWWRSTPDIEQVLFLQTRDIARLKFGSVGWRDVSRFLRMWRSISRALLNISWSTEKIALIDDYQCKIQNAWPSLTFDVDTLCSIVGGNFLSANKGHWLFWSVVSDVMRQHRLRCMQGETMRREPFTVTTYTGSTASLLRIDIDGLAFVAESGAARLHIATYSMLQQILCDIQSRSDSGFFISGRVLRSVASEATVDQMRVLEVLRTGRHSMLFLDGVSGSGKSYIIDVFMRALRVTRRTLRCLILTAGPCARTQSFCHDRYTVTRTIHWLIEKFKHGRVTAIQDANIVIFDNIGQVDAQLFRDMIKCCHQTVARLDLICFLGDTECAKQINHGEYPFRDIVLSADLYNNETSMVSVCTLHQCVRGTKSTQTIVTALCQRKIAPLLEFASQHTVIEPCSKKNLHGILDSLTAESWQGFGIITPYIHGDWGMISLNAEVQHRRNPVSVVCDALLTTRLGNTIRVNDKAMCSEDVRSCNARGLILRKGTSVMVSAINSSLVSVKDNVNRSYEMTHGVAADVLELDYVTTMHRIHGREYATLVVVLPSLSAGKFDYLQYCYRTFSRCSLHLHVLLDDESVLQRMMAVPSVSTSFFVNPWSHSKLGPSHPSWNREHGTGKRGKQKMHLM